MAWSRIWRSWLTTRACAKRGKNPINHSLASTSRWFVGSSSTRCRSPQTGCARARLGVVRHRTTHPTRSAHGPPGVRAPRGSDRRPTLPDTHCFAEGELGVREAANRAITGVVFHVGGGSRAAHAGRRVAGRKARTSWRRPSPVLGRRGVLRQESQRPRHLRPPARRREVADDRAQKGGLAGAISPPSPTFSPV